MEDILREARSEPPADFVDELEARLFAEPCVPRRRGMPLLGVALGVAVLVGISRAGGHLRRWAARRHRWWTRRR